MNKLFLAGLLMGFLTGCGSKAPRWEGKIYQGDPSRAGIQRAQDAEFIPANASIFREFSCVKTEVLVDNIERFKNACKEWKP